MIVQFLDRVASAAGYKHPEYVVTMRSVPEHPLEVTIMKLNDGETLTVMGDHREVAGKLRPLLAVAGQYIQEILE